MFYNWEHNRSSLSLYYIPKIVGFLGYVPLKSQDKTLGEKIVNYRRLSGMSQKELARRLGIDPSTLRRWEKSDKMPPKRMQKELQMLCTVLELDY